jgi:hypothetical protein
VLSRASCAGLRFKPLAVGITAGHHVGERSRCRPRSRPWGDGAVYRDSGTFHVKAPGFAHRGRLGTVVGYWDDAS